MVKRLLAMRETQVQSLGWEDFLEKEVATHSSILAWRIPRTEAQNLLPNELLQNAVFQRLPLDFETEDKEGL